MARMLISLKMCAGDELIKPAYGAIKELNMQNHTINKAEYKNYFDKIDSQDLSFLVAIEI